MSTMPRERAPTHPGEMLREEFLAPLGMTQKELARRLGVSYPRVNELVHGKRGVTPNTALRLARLFRTTPDLWLNLQRTWDLYQALHSPQAAEIDAIEPVSLPQA